MFCEMCMYFEICIVVEVTATKPVHINSTARWNVEILQPFMQHRTSSQVCSSLVIKNWGRQDDGTQAGRHRMYEPAGSTGVAGITGVAAAAAAAAAEAFSPVAAPEAEAWLRCRAAQHQAHKPHQTSSNSSITQASSAAIVHTCAQTA